MSRSFSRSSLCLVGGLIAGILLGGLLPHAPLHAVATDHTENFTIATGPVDDELEAVFLLDFLTGSLKAVVMSTSTGKFASMYETTILDDLGIKQGQNAKFLMVTGVAGLRRTGGNVQPGNSVVYIADVSSGMMAAYAIPWTRGQATATGPFRGALYKLDVARFRQPVRGQ